MRTLLVLRHAKSSWKDPGLTDEQRPLNGRGRRDAPRMGRLLREEGLVPEAILCSSARRARATADLVVESSEFDGPIHHLDDLYHAAPDDVLELVREAPSACTRLMVIGHNPGLELLVQMLTGRSERLPTAALARIDLDVSSWAEAGRPGTSVLVSVRRPRELA